jgi:hypothetical protein
MVLLFTLFLLIHQADDWPATLPPAVAFSAVRQGPVKNQGCVPLYSRRITFRVRNRSGQAIYIHGLKSKLGRHPFGYLIRFDRERNQWLSPEGDTSPRPYKEFVAPVQAFYVPEVYALPPGGSMTFDTLAGEAYLGGRLKRGIYISFGQNEEPRLVTSEEFVLR